MPAVWEEKLETINTSEVHWSAGTVLAIFFAASLVSAVFFGLGYSFGRGGTAKPTFSTAASDAANTVHDATATSSVAPPTSSAVTPVRAIVPAPVLVRNHSISSASVTSTKSLSATPTLKIDKNAAANARAIPGAGQYMVQVGAIGDQKDARRLVAELRRRGFHAGIYPAKHDKFLHVQIGPYATLEQAQNVRRQAAANGFHAILKHTS